MFLYLVQHGLAKSKEEDPERSLTDDGVSETEKVASYIKVHCDVSIERIIHSGKKRARQTAEIFAKFLNPPSGLTVEKELEPMSIPWSWVEKLSQMEEDVMIVGHLPHLRRLASLLLCQDESKPVIEFRNSGVISLYKNESGIWFIRWIIVPDIV